jgi:hypothetical protein
MTARRHPRQLWTSRVALLSALVLAGTLVVTAYAVEGSVYDATWISDSEPVGNPPNTIDVAGGATSVTLRVENVTDDPYTEESLGSANITVPADYTLTGGSVPAEAGSATVDGGTLQLRNLGLTPGSSVDVTINITTPCLPDEAASSWTVIARASSDFSGDSDFALAEGSVAPSTTRDVASCLLRFANQPNTTQTNQTIKTGYKSTGDSLSVVIYDPLTEETVDSDATVTLVASKNPAGGTLTGGSDSAEAGVATFSTLSLNKAGPYKLRASSLVTTNEPVSGQFMVSDLVATCTGSGCSFSQAGGGASYTTTPQQGSAGAGFASSLNLSGLRISCQFGPFNYLDSRQPNSVWYVYDDGPVGSVKTNVILIDASVVKATPENGTSKYRVCYSSPVRFRDRTGAMAPVDPWVNGPTAYFGETWYTGLLPDCAKKNPVAPCVVKWTATSGGHRVGTFLTPPGDPGFR